MPGADDSNTTWQQRARAAYAETQARIPTAWRIDESPVAPAWTDVKQQDKHQVRRRVDHVLEESGISSHTELEIVKTDAPIIIQQLQAGEWTAVETVTGASTRRATPAASGTDRPSSSSRGAAFCKSAAIAQQLYRCCTELFFDRAIARAQELDNFRRETGKTAGTLHGLPISLKGAADHDFSSTR